MQISDPKPQSVRNMITIFYTLNSDKTLSVCKILIFDATAFFQLKNMNDLVENFIFCMFVKYLPLVKEILCFSEN